ncbi:hypothetical protein CI238_04502 [Colletotrichum incanum]|uniref:Uncharacterized protein n=1 Tax=Colletotrichum incanum TaxID=1573173 RepID=A0A167CXX0_COLIC|nr:hypothetical protein CI238_04502 [Colletotrichum incanum]
MWAGLASGPGGCARPRLHRQPASRRISFFCLGALLRSLRAPLTATAQAHPASKYIIPPVHGGRPTNRDNTLPNVFCRLGPTLASLGTD